MAKAETRDAMSKALSILSELTGSKAASQSVRSSVAELISAGSLETLLERHPDLTELVRGLFDWAPGTDSRTTEEVVAAAEELLRAEDDAGRSIYHQAVSMLSYAAAAAPLLEPEHLIDLIEAAYETEQIYAPIRYTATLSAPLRTLIGHYPVERRAGLVSSLWEVAHEGRWWTETIRPTRTYQAGEGYMDETGELVSTSEVLQRLIAGELSYNPLVGAQLSTIESLTERQLADILHRLGRRGKDHDFPILVSHLRPIPLERRPESPVQLIVDALKEALGEQTAAETFPARPERWADICPRGSFEPYPLPAQLVALNGQPLAGMPESEIEVLRHETALVRAAALCGYLSPTYREGQAGSGDGATVLVHSPDPRGGTNTALVSFVKAKGVWKVDEIWGREKAGVQRVDPRVEPGVTYVAQGVLNGRRNVRKPT